LEDAKMVDPCIVGELVSHTHESLVYLGGWLTGTQAMHHKHPETFINSEFTSIQSHQTMTSNQCLSNAGLQFQKSLVSMFDGCKIYKDES
jgi:hypothetical protein